jgi:murein DD-endopeptidase MepM/ murein hydrolase activator NlpD
MSKFVQWLKTHRSGVLSWGVTGLLVAAILSSTIWWTQLGWALGAPQSPTPAAAHANAPSVALPRPVTVAAAQPGIPRQLQLKTIIPQGPRLSPVTYRVQPGDGMEAIAAKFKLKPASITYSNKGALIKDNIEALVPGMEFLIPPVDGMLYKWQEGDTLPKVAAEFNAKPDDIINFIGNDLDLTDPQIKPGTLVMIPGGSRALYNWAAELPTASRVNNGSTGTSDFAGGGCGGAMGPVSSGLGYPTNSHIISGNNYGPSHLGIDLQANMGDPIYAAGSGIVTMAQGGDNYGYGNVIQIDHGNGLVTLYAHLSQINVTVCEIVGRGTVIGLAGATGNAFGAHLHFEVRRGGVNINPLSILQ